MNSITRNRRVSFSKVPSLAALVALLAGLMVGLPLALGQAQTEPGGGKATTQAAPPSKEGPAGASTQPAVPSPAVPKAAASQPGAPAGDDHEALLAELEKLDSEMAKAVREFDVDEYIKSRNPPSVEEIIKSREPIPTLEQVLELSRDPSKRPPIPTLPEDVAKEVVGLEQQIEELEAKGLRAWGPDALSKAEQDAALDEGVALAQRVLAIREQHQGPESEAGKSWGAATGEKAKTRGEWYEVIGARRKVSDLRLIHGFDAPQRTEVQRAREFNAQGEQAYNAGNAAKAEPLYRDALAMLQRLFPGDHPGVARGLNNLATILQACGALAQAEPFARDALAMRQRLFPGDHPDVARSLNNLALILQARGALEQAEPLCRDALAMRQRLSPGDHSSVATSLNNLAGLLKDRGVLEQAEPLYRDALAMRQRLFPGDHPDVARSLNGLASILQARGALEQAEPLYRDALAMWQRLVPGDHPDVAGGLNGLASILQARGALEHAEPLYRDSLAMCQRLFPGDHPYVAVGLGNLAFILKARGALDQAEPLYREALAMWQRLFPGDHPDVARGLNNLAVILKDRGGLEQAEPVARDALAMTQRLFPGDHPDVARSLNNLAGILKDRGGLEQAEPLYRDALAMYRRLFPGDHPYVALSLNNLAVILKDRGGLEQAEPLARDALAMSERLRTKIVGGERERADFAAELQLTQRSVSYASLLTKLNRGRESFAVIERGRGRAILDLLERSGRDLIAEARALGDKRAARVDAALAAEDAARITLASTEALLGGRSRERQALEGREETEQAASEARDKRLAEYEREITGLKEKVARQRQSLAQAGAAVLNELRGLFPATDPLTREALLAALSPGELVVSFAWSGETVMTLTATGAKDGQGDKDGGQGETTGVIVAENKDAVKPLAEAAGVARAALASRPDGTLLDSKARDAARTLLAALLPEAVRAQVTSAKRLIVTPDGPLHGIPLEALLVLAGDDPLAQSLAGKPIAYAPTATMYARGKAAGTRTSDAARTAVVLGDPLFDRDAPPEPKYPLNGVLLAMVQDGGNAAQAGLKRGDVLLSYAGKPLAAAKDLGPAIAAVTEERTRGDEPADARTVPAKVWRGGKKIKVKLAPGRLGVQPIPGSPGETLRSWARQERGYDALAAEVTATDQVRLHGGLLTPLPGTRREAEAVAAMLPGSTLLVGEEATAPRLRAAVFDSKPRIVHLATHGLTGNAQRPYDASLALTRPAAPSAGDVGFLTLDELIGKWLGRLRGCELVVLSACDTGRGTAKGGDSVMALPIGFFAGGAQTVVASLWKVDDTATALLMSRFYANVLGKTGSARQIDGITYKPGEAVPKLAALREAQGWLRGLTIQDKDRLTKSRPEQIAEAASRGEVVPRRGGPGTPPAGDDHPFDHPYYWAAFVLFGNAE